MYNLKVIKEVNILHKFHNIININTIPDETFKGLPIHKTPHPLPSEFATLHKMCSIVKYWLLHEIIHYDILNVFWHLEA